MNKIALFAFNGDPMCFIHVLLNALNMKERGHEVRIVIEGAATRLLSDLASEGSPLSGLFTKAREQGVIEGACRACSAKMKTLEEADRLGIALLGDMAGHPSMSGFLDRGYTIISF